MKKRVALKTGLQRLKPCRLPHVLYIKCQRTPSHSVFYSPPQQRCFLVGCVTLRFAFSCVRHFGESKLKLSSIETGRENFKVKPADGMGRPFRFFIQVEGELSPSGCSVWRPCAAFELFSWRRSWGRTWSRSVCFWRCVEAMFRRETGVPFRGRVRG